MHRFSPILEEFIHKDAHILANHVANTITISEPKNTAGNELHSVKIKDFQKVYFALKLDLEAYPFLGNLIPKGVWRKSVDAVIFGKVNKRDYIFLIEMKSKDTKGVSQKFKSSKAFISFLFTIFEEHYGVDVRENTKICCILFDRRVQKGRPQTNDAGYRRYGFDATDNETTHPNITPSSSQKHVTISTAPI